MATVDLRLAMAREPQSGSAAEPAQKQSGGPKAAARRSYRDGRQAMPILWFFNGNERMRWPVALK